ncbi:MAG TPA: recombinase family protein [Kofleriaceae bacterium]|nr:recombinase family protein [Kofleriaceae bacterium]
MTPVAIYARYSTDKQDARSIEDQLRRCREYAERHDQEVVAEFSDAATSGAHTDRVNLRRMLDVATATKRPPFKAVIVDDLSRLSRDLGDTWRIIFTDFAAVDVKVIDASTGMASDASGARTMFAAMAMVNDTFLQLVRHETHRGLQGRAIAGFSTGGSLYGFKTFEEENPADREHPRKLWAIDEAEAEVVRRIYRMFDEGSHGYRSIADQLNREGIAPPRNNGRGGKHGGGWGHSTIRAILTNEKYMGRWRWNATKWIRVPGKRARRQLARPESEHVVREYLDLAIIDQITWHRVQAKFERRKQGEGRGEIMRANQRTYMLSGLLRCGVCGGPMSVSGQKLNKGVRYASFGCTAHASRGGAICSNKWTINEKKLTEAFLSAMKHEVLLVPHVLNELAAEVERRAAERAASGLDELERKLRGAEARVKNATKLMIDMPDDQDIRQHREADLKEVARLKAELAAHAVATAGPLPTKAQATEATRIILNAISDAAPDRAREVLTKTLAPLLLTPKIEGPNHLVEVTGSLDFSAVLPAGFSSGGRI